MGRLRYKGYTGSVEYSEEDNCFVGEVLGLSRDGIIYEGSSVEELKKDFEDGIDHYLACCKAGNVEPEKPYSGKLVLRLTPDLHGEAAMKAADLGISLNEFIRRAILSAIR
ncbi:MAG: type II toxin-antitoxin system HicB family antitoxin [Bacteroidales bacterium]|jgi:predicted HicB family RNase H-like nuclease|nr:type II toxin-antitoxin system HicB family antitoxin [Bacteroidales bacterium]MBP5383061.1 type II toxin-antitoxin system HicB family antitoxin [Bacteroidales bacterium]